MVGVTALDTILATATPANKALKLTRSAMPFASAALAA